MIFNNYDFSSDLKILAIRRNLLAPLSVKTIKRQGTAGVLVANKTKESRLEPDYIEVDIEIMQATKALKRAKVRHVAEKLLTENLAKLVLPDEPGKYEMVMLADESRLTELYTIGTATLRFFRPVPVSYGATFTDLSLATAQVYNGNYPTTAILKITCTGTTDELIINKGGAPYIKIYDNFTAGTAIEIDLEKESVKKNGSVYMDKVSFDSRFFKLENGSIIITATPLADWSDITITFTERWL